MSTDTGTEKREYDEELDEDEHFEWLLIQELHDDPENLRQEYDGIEDLAQSIKAQGLLQPIVVRRDAEGKYFIIAGHRRKRALILNGSTRTRVIVSHREFLREDVIANMLIENGQRKDLNPMEQAFGLALLKSQTDANDIQIGEMIGRSQPWVTDRLRLLDLTPDEQQAVREGRMTIGEGKRVGRLHSGHVRPGAQGKKSGGHFTSAHDLGEAASKRCKHLGHKAGGPNYYTIACGKCWEHVIRASERKVLREKAFEHGNCGTCGQPVDPEAAKEEPTSDEGNSEK